MSVVLPPDVLAMARQVDLGRLCMCNYQPPGKTACYTHEAIAAALLAERRATEARVWREAADVLEHDRTTRPAGLRQRAAAALQDAMSTWASSA